MKPKLPDVIFPILFAAVITGGMLLAFSYKQSARNQSSDTQVAALQSRISGL